jgi:hypothetical protein
MWSLLKSLLLKWAALRALLRILGSLGWLLPLALVLKAVGLPVLMLLAVLALPIIIVLAVIGLPFLLIFVVGGALLAFIMWVVSLGLMALKIALPIVLVVWVIRWFLRNGEERGPGTATPGTEGGSA